MPTAKKSAANGTPAKKRENVTLPASVDMEEDVIWPGQSRNGNNAALKEQLAEDIAEMEFGSVRRYAITGAKEQQAFLNLFRGQVDKVHSGKYGVAAVLQSTGVIVKLGNKTTRPRKAAKSVASAK
jgi:hypothetical protein